MFKAYISSFKRGLSETIAFPLDFTLGIFQIIFMIGINVFIWTYIIKVDTTSITERLAYFLMANGISSLIGGSDFNFGATLGQYIKDGDLTEYLLKPINPLALIYGYKEGRSLNTIVVGSIFIIASLFFAEIYSPIQIALFFLSLIPAFVIIISLNIVVGASAFYFTDASGIKQVSRHMTRLLNGSKIPLDTFSEIAGPVLSALVIWGPSAASSFTPTHILLAQSLNSIDMRFVFSSLGWSIISPILAYLIWNRGLRKYDGTGI